LISTVTVREAFAAKEVAAKEVIDVGTANLELPLFFRTRL
jgi:hypothetical protein